ncbi:MAG: molybdopterin-guanine dinucleotide biosynthesis protein B [Geminicoccaceae bacterium]|nr:molybdopterin-guanine dinucleotide biosynthesis protein B [Geminicoccaceae bacterium]MCB9945731.1 molybdopterin-guanine dinucleotide biosynthesis protein B [Geminicoccaceae bacterium]
MRVIGIVGWKNNGKTTLVVKLVEHFTRAGLSVSTIKHAHHSVEIDKPGKDTWRHREAGAREVLLATSKRWALMHEMAGEDDAPLDELLPRLSPCDLVVVEGFKRFPHAKIEVHLVERGRPLLAHGDPTVVAVASNHIIDPPPPVPVIDINDIDAIAALALARAEPA